MCIAKLCLVQCGSQRPTSPSYCGGPLVHVKHRTKKGNPHIVGTTRWVHTKDMIRYPLSPMDPALVHIQ